VIEPAAEAPPSIDRAPAPAPPAESSASNWWVAALLAALAIIGGILLLRRRRAAQEAAPPVLRAAPVAAPPPPPPFAPPPPSPPPPPPPPPPKVPAPSPVGSGTVGISLRPQLEFDVRAETATVSSSRVAVDFALAVGNSGNSPARDVRIEARLFSAGADQDERIAAWFKTAFDNGSAGRLPDIDPHTQIKVASGAHLSADEIATFDAAGRALFVPLLAVTILYHWGNGRAGRTSQYFVLGRPPAEGSDRIGPFILRPEPRTYTPLDRRHADLVETS
jgi:hypothetical protein